VITFASIALAVVNNRPSIEVRPFAVLAPGGFLRQGRCVHIDLGGHPLHTRALALTLVQRADGRLDFDSYVLDLRKRGFVPVGGDLQPSGIVHHMRLFGVVDPARRTIESIRADQPSVAFEPSPQTQGESCRDPIDRIGALAGTSLSDGYADHLKDAVGGARGCYHIATLGHFLGSAVSWALDSEPSPLPSPASNAEEGTQKGRQKGLADGARRAGERVFRRDVIIDGHQREDNNLEIAVQQTDLHFRPGGPVAPPMERFEAAREVRVQLEVDLKSFRFSHASAAERLRARNDLQTASWTDLTACVARLVGVPSLVGLTAEVKRRFGHAASERPLLDALLMVAPGLIQITAALSEDWPAQASRTRSIVGIAGIPDSCYMWRRDGALHKARRGDDPVPTMTAKGLR
jgi:hypothetical protein